MMNLQNEQKIANVKNLLIKELMKEEEEDHKLEQHKDIISDVCFTFFLFSLFFSTIELAK